MKVLMASAVAGLVFLASGTASAGMDPFVEVRLIDVCKKISNDRVIPLRHAVKGYNLSYEEIGEKLVCNGYNVVAWAQVNGASKTAGDLKRKVGTVTISDLAMAGERWEVNYN